MTKSNTSHIITELGLIEADQCTRERRSDQGPVDVKTIPLITRCISGTRPIIALIKYSILRTVKHISFDVTKIFCYGVKRFTHCHTRINVNLNFFDDL